MHQSVKCMEVKLEKLILFIELESITPMQTDALSRQPVLLPPPEESCDEEVELGGTQNLKTVRYFIKYHGTNNYHSI